MSEEIAQGTASIVRGYTADGRDATARVLRARWLEHEPNRAMELVKAEQREQYEVARIPIPILKADVDVRRAVSFAIRVRAKADPQLVCEYLKRHVPSSDHSAVWVLCDVTRSMDRRIVGEFADLQPAYVEWREAPGMTGRDLSSIDGATRALRGSW